MFTRFALRAFLVLALLSFASPCLAAKDDPAPVSADQIREVLKANPDIILEILRDNSELVLDVVQQGSDLRRRQGLLRQWQLDSESPKNVDLEKRPSRGPAKAPITLIAFSDFTCSYCQQAAITIENLLKRYPNQIRYVFKQFPQDSELGYKASQWFVAANRQDPVKAWNFYALLFERQRAYVSDQDAVLAAAAKDAGLDPKAIQTDLKTNAKAIDAIIEADKADAKALGFNGTPYFLVNDLIIRGALPLENFIDAVEMALQAKK